MCLLVACVHKAVAVVQNLFIVLFFFFFVKSLTLMTVNLSWLGSLLEEVHLDWSGNAASLGSIL